MWCVKCQNDLTDCVCEDINERLDSIGQSKHIVFRACSKCERHYSRCQCENPKWTTSDKLIPTQEE